MRGMGTFVSILIFATLTVAGCGLPAREESHAAPPEGTGGAARDHQASGDEDLPPPVLPPVVPGAAPPNPYSQAQIERGRLLVAVGNCSECHTPWAWNEALGSPAPDRARFLSGHPAGVPGPKARPRADLLTSQGATGTSFVMPFGVIFAPNLTPDVDTGTGSWSEEMFLNVFRKGTHMGGGGRPVLPPMPWPNIALLPDEDLVAIFAYLRSIPPIHNGVTTLNPPQEVMDGISKTNEMILQEIAAHRQTQISSLSKP